jgi:hypothetical protein
MNDKDKFIKWISRIYGDGVARQYKAQEGDFGTYMGRLKILASILDKRRQERAARPANVVGYRTRGLKVSFKTSE